MKVRRILRTCVVLAGLFPAPHIAYSATVDKVYDGDSLVATLDSGHTIEVRLAEIDAPEKGQPFSKRSADALRTLVLDQEIEIEIFDIDQYDRVVARIRRSSDGLYVNAWLVENGFAWVYPKYARDQSLYTLQEAAIKLNKGLWALPENQRVPPWQWRHSQRQK